MRGPEGRALLPPPPLGERGNGQPSPRLEGALAAGCPLVTVAPQHSSPCRTASPFPGGRWWYEQACWDHADVSLLQPTPPQEYLDGLATAGWERPSNNSPLLYYACRPYLQSSTILGQHCLRKGVRQCPATGNSNQRWFHCLLWALCDQQAVSPCHCRLTGHQKILSSTASHDHPQPALLH
jgi:hypothetical protein